MLFLFFLLLDIAKYMITWNYKASTTRSYTQITFTITLHLALLSSSPVCWETSNNFSL